MAQRCCSRQPGNDNDGPALLSAQQPWDIDAVAAGKANDNDGTAMRFWHI
jgi:hypothetical protein